MLGCRHRCSQYARAYVCEKLKVGVGVASVWLWCVGEEVDRDCSMCEVSGFDALCTLTSSKAVDSVWARITQARFV